MLKADFRVDLNESFPRLARPPIVEAVIHWQARAERNFEPVSLQESLVEKLPRYPQCRPIQEMRWIANLTDSEEALAIDQPRGKAFSGYRLSSEDGRDVVQFKRDGLVFSRTQSYEHWEPFVVGAKEAWKVFQAIAEPIEVQRLGVRFINHLAGATPETLADYLNEPPTCPSNLPLQEFLYQSTFRVPGNAFGVRVIKVMQPQSPELKQSSGLFIDIDVFTINAMPNDAAALDQALAQMRWLKNKVFFALVTESAVHRFGEGA